MPQNPTRITQVTGIVLLQRDGEQRWFPVSVGTEIRFGDMLKKQPGAEVTICCSDRTAGMALPDGVPKGLGYICPTMFRNASDPAIPYTISPCNTLILTNQPTLRWHAPDNANRFKVIVRGQGLNWTKQLSREEACQGDICELVYPGDQPLQSGVSYKLVIETTDTNRSSEEITAPGLGFKLIDEDKAIEIQNIAQEIEQQEFPTVEKALKLADLYYQNLLTAEAIATLEILPHEEKNPAVYRQLGKLYHSIALPLEAKADYQKAITKAKAVEDKSEVAAAQVGLAEVNWTLGKKDEARSLLETAKAIYTELGNADMVSYLEERLREMAAHE
ncbi:MAG: tetratricopeptide repeat protein [Nostocaceae cyanobacterium]|nr:tetratricopeptide repeat protein [Nostocaceae cyanobacterium]